MTATQALAQVGRAIREAALAEQSPDWVLSYRRRCIAADERLLAVARRAALYRTEGLLDELRDAVRARDAIKDELARRVEC